MSRLFAFGCSFTNYRWSTWADCLAPEFDNFENWGQSGAGNEFIFNSVMEADQRQQFGTGDTVIVCWTTSTRDTDMSMNVGTHWVICLVVQYTTKTTWPRMLISEDF